MDFNWILCYTHFSKEIDSDWKTNEMDVVGLDGKWYPKPAFHQTKRILLIRLRARKRKVHDERNLFYALAFESWSCQKLTSIVGTL